MLKSSTTDILDVSNVKDNTTPENAHGKNDQTRWNMSYAMETILLTMTYVLGFYGLVKIVLSFKVVMIKILCIFQPHKQQRTWQIGYSY